ncbi:hypothetical protein ACFPVS_05070 [Neisseria weixii]|uniref:Uncharacterized protein n=1 Tax=Neisseria weixii TaxID=1853276 RepID=A0A3N4N6R8_9NEIS|nr:hypothetical protein [Neisseria weixii]RPD90808.1 hypothetical protein EGK74_00170 [Neisseria weixii]RPD91001.1 hypothetical protein EGK75_00170 [Neisseria weixii]
MRSDGLCFDINGLFPFVALTASQTYPPAFSPGKTKTLQSHKPTIKVINDKMPTGDLKSSAKTSIFSFLLSWGVLQTIIARLCHLALTNVKLTDLKKFMQKQYTIIAYKKAV